MHFKPQRKIKINWSPNFAYAIGLIVSDCYLSSDARHIGFKSADRELVEKFKIAIGIQNKIGGGARSNEKVKKYFYVTFGDIVFYRFLNEIGIKSAKSKIIKSIIVPDEFFKDFLRGLFDGDGTFYSFWDKRWKSSFCYQISFASASPNFISWLKTKLNKLYNVKGFIRKGDGVFNLRYVKGDTRRLFTIMYGNKENQLFLERKYIKIIRALDKDRK